MTATMHLDPLTLMVPEIIASAVASLFVLGAWFRFRESPALLWWGSGHALYTVGLAFLTAAMGMQAPAILPVGGIAISIAPILFWAGVRSFLDMRPLWPVLAGAPAAPALVSALPLGDAGQSIPAALGFLIWPVFLAAAAWLLVTKRTERLPARWPLAGLMVLHSAIYTFALGDILSGRFDALQPPSLASWFGIIHFETILFSMGTGFLMILICHERKEQNIIEAASIDPLTGASNRDAFFEAAERILARDERAASPCSMIMFDLDRFKAINDSYGHQFGDRILEGFGETVRRSLRPRDFFGRYGGEEFLIVLPGTSPETAALIANRIRQAFAGSHAFVDGKPVKATASAGVANAAVSGTLEDLIRDADHALYAAKQKGRNRVEMAADNVMDTGIVHIA